MRLSEEGYRTMKPKVLFIGGGRRKELAKKFIERGFDVFSYEVDQYCPISKVANIIHGVKWKNDQIINDIEENIKKYKIDISIPLQDEAIFACSEVSNIICSFRESANICFDKIAFENFMLSDQILKQYYPFLGEDKHNVIKKYRYGYGSKNIYKINKLTEEKDGDFVYQKIIEGTEYTVDCYFDKNNKFFKGISRTRERVADGEVIDSRIKINTPLIETSKLIGEKLKLKGPICMQYIISNQDSRPYLFEINARFGGGSSFSIEAGLDMIDMIKKEYITNESILSENYPLKEIALRRSLEDNYFNIN